MRSQSILSSHISNATIARAWENFNDTGAFQPDAIRKVIGRGWIKSRELGISTEKERAPTVITSDEIAEIERTESLVQASKPVLDQLAQTLTDTRHVVVLADANSRILYSSGHRPIQERLEQINFRPGADWSEHLVGPNGVGTSLILGRPEIVMGYEHYCKAWQPWVCYGAPIFDASGTVLKGTIDITGPVEQANRESMAMAMSLAQSIGANLTVAELRKREQLREHGKLILQKWSGTAVMIVDDLGYIADYNNKAACLLGQSDRPFLNHDISSLVPDLGQAFHECVNTDSLATVELQQRPDINSTDREALQVNLEVIRSHGKCLGVAVVFEADQARLGIPNVIVGRNANLKALGDEVIKSTLKQTNYNISQAAKLLGIDRTTIYRRMRKWSS